MAQEKAEVGMDDLLDRVPCGVLSLADDGTLLRTNATLRALLGYEHESLAGQHVDSLLAPGARIFYQSHVFPLLRMQGRVDEVYLSLRAADGADVPVLLNAVRRDADRVSDWVVVVMHRRSRFEDELLQAKKAAEEAVHAKDRFLSMLSHDVRAPLSGISLSAGLLAQGMAGPVTERQRHELARMKEASQYVLRLVKDLLNYARLQAGRAEMRIEPVSVEDVFARASAMVQHLVDAAELTLHLEGGLEAAGVFADPDRLQQILLNLLTNAIKYTAPGGRVTLASTCDAGRVRLHVRDTGCGIPADRIDGIFHPFVQLERVREAPDAASRGTGEGVGLGLAISRELARGMGGELTVESRLGEGSAFTVHLPAAPLPASSKTAMEVC